MNVLDSYVRTRFAARGRRWPTQCSREAWQRSNRKGYPRIGMEKCVWASQIGQHLDVESNLSRSFQVFRSGLLKLCASGE